jgi:hypothetical protein
MRITPSIARGDQRDARPEPAKGAAIGPRVEI